MQKYLNWSVIRVAVAVVVAAVVISVLLIGSCSGGSDGQQVGTNQQGQTQTAGQQNTSEAQSGQSDSQQPGSNEENAGNGAPSSGEQEVIVETNAGKKSGDDEQTKPKDKHWVPDGKKGMRYLHDDGSNAKGFVDIGKKTYLFDDEGHQLTGWRVVNDEYRYFKQSWGKKGSMVKNKVVNGIMLTDDGVAVLTEEAIKELEVLHKGQKLCDELTDPLDSKIEKLGKMYDWLLKSCQERGSHPFKGEEGWQRAFALDIFDTKSGSCESFGAGFAYLAIAAGAKEVNAVCSGGHAWAEVDGTIYDPEQGKQSQNSWEYFDLDPAKSGQGEIPLYASSREFVAKLAPREETWGTVSEADIESTEEEGGQSGWVEEDGTKHYYKNGRQMTQKWAKDGSKKYYLMENGEPAKGSVNVEGAWYVFDDEGVLMTGDGTRVVELDGALYQVDADGKAQPGWVESEVEEENPGFIEVIRSAIFGPKKVKRYYLENGAEAHGDCFAEGKIMSFSEEGDFDEGRSNDLQRLCESEDKAKELLDKLGEPQDVQSAPSCRPGYEDGSENTYRYQNLTVRTYAIPDGAELLNYVESNSAAGAGQASEDATAQDASGSGDQTAAVDEQVAQFVQEHGNDLEACFEALRYNKDADNFIRYGATGRPELETSFDDERIAQEARAAFIDHSEGDCYTYTVAFWLVAQKLGYEARPMVGTMIYSNNGEVHNTCWVEIKKGDSWNIYDPLHADSLHDVPYGTYETVKRAGEEQ